MSTPEWNREIGHWAAWLKAGAARPATVTLRRYQLGRLAADLAPRRPWAVSVNDLAGWIASHDWGLETTRSHRAALRSFYGWAHASGHISADPARLLRKVPAAQPRPRPAAERVVRPAIAAADDRVRMMLLLGSRCGLRRSEIAQVHSADLIEDLLGWSLIVHGKGGKERTIPLMDDISTELRNLGPGYAFPGRNNDGHLGAPWVAKLMKRAMLGQASSHQLRHRFATVAYRESGDILALSRVLGHASVATTQRYVATDPAALRHVMAAAG